MGASSLCGLELVSLWLPVAFAFEVTTHCLVSCGAPIRQHKQQVASKPCLHRARRFAEKHDALNLLMQAAGLLCTEHVALFKCVIPTLLVLRKFKGLFRV